MSFTSNVLIALATFVCMEPLAWALHRYVMHGVGWGWHRSHHEPGPHKFEHNDLFALAFSIPSASLCAIGYYLPELALLGAVGVGIAAYGAAYFFVHDCLIHQRIPVRLRAPKGYLKRLIQAHRLHHATRGREGAVSFGLLYAPPPAELARSLRARKKPAVRSRATARVRAPVHARSTLAPH